MILFIGLFLQSGEQTEIKLVIQGSYRQNFLNGGPNPSEVTVNGGTPLSNSKWCDFNQDMNNVVIKFGSLLESCEEMFKGLVNIIEIDFSNFDTSKIISMSFMFSGCTNLKSITFGNYTTSSLNNLYQTFGYCSNLISVDLSHFDTSSVTTMMELFSHCESISSLDVSTFNTANVVDMYDLFGYCYSLTSINVSNFDTSKVTVMQGMFYRNYKLTYLDISNYNTISATNVKSMFGDDSLIEYINMSTFKITSTTENGTMFAKHHENLTVCLTDIDTERILVSQIRYFLNFDCSDKCFPKTYKYDLCEYICLESCDQSECKFDYKDICYYRCPNTTYEPDDREYFCEDKVEGQGYYFSTTREVFKQCHYKCKKCFGKGDNINTQCIECNDNYIFLNESMTETINNCYDKCTHYYYFNGNNEYKCTDEEQCPTGFNKLIREKKKCIDTCKNDNFYKYEFNNICYLQCPNGTNETGDHICTLIPVDVEPKAPTTQMKDEPPSTQIKTDSPTTQMKDELPSTQVKTDSPTTETVSNTVNICFHSCKSCSGPGNDANNNCIECKEGFTFLDEFTNKINCYNECPYYYYFNELNKYLCTEDESCPAHYTKLIPDYKKCIDECKKDRKYKYEYNNICYEQCPTGTSETQDYICEEENEPSDSILYNCSSHNDLMDICSIIGINNNSGIYNIIRNNMLAASSRNDKMQIIGGENNTIYQITKNKNELDLLENENLSDNYTLSIIDLGECESILKESYHLNDTDNLIILKKETLSDKSSEKDIQFEVFEPYSLKKLNLSLCLSTSINIYVKLELSSETEALNEELQKLGFNMFDINNRFYTDMCTPFKTSRKTDMILSDRIDDIYNNMDAQCQPNCQFSGYMFGSEYINCTCSVDIYEEK